MFGLWTFILDHPRWEYLVNNCSKKTIDEWKLESIPNLPLAIFYITMGVVFELIYIPFMLVMKRPEFIRFSCYKFMFQLCIIDMFVIPFNAISAGVQTVFGLHFCTNPSLFYITGSIGSAGWYAGSITCVLLAIDRFLEMIKPKIAKHLFEGKRFFIYPTLTVAYILFTFTQLPAPYSTRYHACFFDPFIGTINLEFMPQFYDFTFHFIHNFTVVILLGTFYLALCLIYMTKFRTLIKANLSQHQKLLTIQALCICVEFFIAALVYVFMQIFQVSEFIIVMGHVCWILMHGDTPIVYLILNKSLREAVFNMIRRRNGVSNSNERVFQQQNSINRTSKQ